MFSRVSRKKKKNWKDFNFHRLKNYASIADLCNIKEIREAIIIRIVACVSV